MTKQSAEILPLQVEVLGLMPELLSLQLFSCYHSQVRAETFVLSRVLTAFPLYLGLSYSVRLCRIWVINSI